MDKTGYFFENFILSICPSRFVWNLIIFYHKAAWLVKKKKSVSGLNKCKHASSLEETTLSVPRLPIGMYVEYGTRNMPDLKSWRTWKGSAWPVMCHIFLKKKIPWSSCKSREATKYGNMILGSVGGLRGWGGSGLPPKCHENLHQQKIYLKTCKLIPKELFKCVIAYSCHNADTIKFCWISYWSCSLFFLFESEHQ